MGSIAANPGAITPTTPREPTIVVQPRVGWQPINFRELWQFRELLWNLTLRDVSIRYRQTILGVLWAVIQPVTQMVVFTVFFGKIMRAEETMKEVSGVRIPYAVFALSGQIFWQFFASAVSSSSNSLVSNVRLLQKVYLPRLVLPISAVGAPAADFFFALAVLAAMLMAYGLSLHLEMLLLPLIVASVVVAALGVGIGLSALTVAYRDFRLVVPFLVGTWFFATPVVWPISQVPEQYQWLMYFNPMTGPIQAFRSALWGEPIEWLGWLLSVGVGLVACTMGVFYFARVERQFADQA